jgi:hypothetical protein
MIEPRDGVSQRSLPASSRRHSSRRSPKPRCCPSWGVAKRTRSLPRSDSAAEVGLARDDARLDGPEDLG